ncbi:28S ribosomal protein S30, mitochondrial-like isoform X2 [Penaeus japonicus]|uniref:28S ribosomal protein S30, mitochondrial-like isoform X2 n=1 Tax=Penaeus japonicus TaxID=27405 RepID=UPI001C713C5B|nr:28S ribosomal protein S30, mitochondrial-like isoform X2 [Penaeus japonicus]
MAATRLVWKGRTSSTFLRVSYLSRDLARRNHNAASLSEYTDVPEYPEILDENREARKRRKTEAWHQKITGLPTLEQKLMELNMPKYYGYWSCRLHDAKPTLQGTPFTRYATRTHVVEGLPEGYHEKEAAGALAKELKDSVEELILLNFQSTLSRRNFGLGRAIEKRQTQNFLLGLHKILASSLAPSAEHLKDAVVDIRPRVEAFWFLGGLQPDNLLKKKRRNFKYMKDKEHDPMERSIQAESSPCLCVRTSLGLPEVVSREDSLATSAPVPVENLDPRAYGFKFKHKHATIVTGFWPGEKKEHSQLWLHSREFEEKFGLEFGLHNVHNALIQKMIISSFSQAFAHATYQGFGPVTELTYPIVHQSAISDGQKWNFSLYQMNTCVLHSENATENPYNNILWLSPEQNLFEAVEESGVKGLNEEVLTSLIAMYLKKGIIRENASPYLAPYKYLAGHNAPEEYREEFQNYLRDLLSGRPRKLLKPEMYLWEKIYKKDNNTRPYESPRRFFEDHFNQMNPEKRRLDEYSPIYIPKACRKDKKQKHKPRLDSENLYKYD